MSYNLDIRVSYASKLMILLLIFPELFRFFGCSLSMKNPKGRIISLYKSQNIVYFHGTVMDFLPQPFLDRLMVQKQLKAYSGDGSG